MFYDLNNITSKTNHKYGICIIGAGPAGITLANELEKKVGGVCILESGGLTREYHSKALKSVVSGVGEIKSNSQERIFGGTSLTWDGLSAPLDPVDFSYRAYLSAPGWPITYQEILPYYHRAASTYGFPILRDFRTFQSYVIKKMDLPFNLPAELQLKTYLKKQKHIFFGERFKSLLNNPNVDVYIHATTVKLVSIGTSDNKEKVLVAKVKNELGASYKIKASQFVLAAGCFENTRILLLSRDVCKTGIGNQHDIVGRYFMNHLKGFAGEFDFKNPLKEYLVRFGKASRYSRYKDYFGYVGFRLSGVVQRKESLMNSNVRMQPVLPWMDNIGVHAIIFFYKKARFFYLMQLMHSCVRVQSIFAWVNSVGVNTFTSMIRKANYLLIKLINNSTPKIVHWKNYPTVNEVLFTDPVTFFDYLKLIATILTNLIPVTCFVFALALNKSVKVRKVRVENFMEMEPNYSNRITLSKKTDLYGNYLPETRYQASLRDKKTLLKIHNLLSSNIKKNNNIRFVSELILNGDLVIHDSSHYLGGTRMGNDYRYSVVDKNLQVYGLKNLFIVGGSVFPTGGNSNPTFTICALAIRLADHLLGYYEKKSVKVEHTEPINHNNGGGEC